MNHFGPDIQSLSAKTITESWGELRHNYTLAVQRMGATPTISKSDRTRLVHISAAICTHAPCARHEADGTVEVRTAQLPDLVFSNYVTTDPQHIDGY